MTTAKRKLAWEEQGADLSCFDRPSILGGPGDKRVKDFSVKAEAMKGPVSNPKPGAAKKPSEPGRGAHGYFNLACRLVW